MDEMPLATSAGDAMAAEVDRSGYLARLPSGMLGAVVLIVLVNLVLGKLRWDNPPRSRLSASWQWANRAAEGPEAGAEVLCFGDSLIKLGIVPRVLEERLGRSSYNLAVLGGPAPASHELLRRVLDRGCRPRAMVVHFSPLLLGMDPKAGLEWWAGGLRIGDRLALLGRTRDPSMVGSLIMHGLFGSIVARDAIRSALGLRSESSGYVDRLGREGIEELVVGWTQNQGTQLAPREFVPVAGSLPKPYLGRGWSWAPNPVHAYFVDRFLAMAQEREIPVYWVIPPADAAWLDRNEDVGTVRAYREYVRGLLGRYEVLTVLDAQKAGWGRRWFRDPIHLNRDGAVRLSGLVATAIVDGQGAPASVDRWIAMDQLDQTRPADDRLADGPITMEGPR